MSLLNTRLTGQVAVCVMLAVAFLPRAALALEPKVDVIRLPDGGIYPQAQTDDRGRIHLIYFKGDDARRGDIFYVRSDDGGTTFTQPLRVNSHPNSAIVMGTVRGPHLALGKDDRPHVGWMGSDRAEPKALGKHIPMLYTRLNDKGDAFEPHRNVIQNHPGLDGGGSVAADRSGNVYVVWHAAEKAPGGETGHKHGGSGEEDRRVWVARSQDDGKTFEAERAAITKRTGVCACCGLNVIATDDGRVLITFRSAAAMVNRDIHVLSSSDFGKTFKIALVDPWKIGQCVMSTAAFARRGQDVLAAWETEEQVRLAPLGAVAADAKVESMPGKAKQRKHPSVAANADGASVVAWTEGTGWNKGGTVVWQSFDPQGRPVPGQPGRAAGLDPWNLPAVVALKDGSFKIIF